MIRTNQPSAFGKANGFTSKTDPGFTYYIDDGYDGKVPADPFYDSGYNANHVNFIDRPSRAFDPGAIWNAHLFVVNDVVKDGAHTVTIYDGIYYGFSTAVPEPATLALAAVGSAGWLLVARRRRAAAAESPAQTAA